MKKLFIGGMLLAGIIAFAGTCTLQNFQLQQTGSFDTYGGEIHNDTGTNFLQHNVMVAFVDSNGAVVDSQTVTPCLRTLQTGSATYFSATSTQPASTTANAIARLQYGSSLIVGNAATGSGTISNLGVNRSTTTLTVTGKFQNTDSTLLQAPNACAVVYSNTGKVLVVGLDQSMPDLSQSASDTFSISMTVPNDSSLVSYVNVYVDGLKNGVPILPITDLNNTVSLGASMIAFTVQPGGGNSGAVWATQPVVALKNADGTIATTAPSTLISLSISSGSGGGTLNCPSVYTSSGQASFSNCYITQTLAGSYGYVLTASATVNGVTLTTTSTTFYINGSALGPAAKLAFIVQPTNTQYATAMASVTVAIEDASGNTVTTGASSTANVTIALGGGGGGGGVPTCTSTLTVAAVAGVATFTGCQVSLPGPAYYLTATSGVLTQAQSNAFNITTAAANKLVLTTQPAAATHGTLTTQPVVKLEDAAGNVVFTDNTDTVTLTLTQVSGSGVLSCTTNPVTLSAGVATFAGCSISLAGTYHITASTTTLGGITVAVSTPDMVLT